MLRKAAERTVCGLWDIIDKLVAIFQTNEVSITYIWGYEPE